MVNKIKYIFININYMMGRHSNYRNWVSRVTLKKRTEQVKLHKLHKHNARGWRGLGVYQVSRAIGRVCVSGAWAGIPPALLRL